MPADRTNRLFFVLLLILIPSRAIADEWPPPEVKTYYSQDHHARFTVTPRDISSPLSYFSDKVTGEVQAGQRHSSTRTFALGVLEKESDARRWKVVWHRPLVNDVSPVSAVVSNSTLYVVTFDNWHFMGEGNDAIVVYGADGHVVRSLSLSEILPDYYVYALPRSVSSIWWSGNHRIAEPNDTLILKIVIPSNDEHDRDNPKFVDLPLLLPTGQVRPRNDLAWQGALSTARTVATERHAEEKAHDIWFESPLRSPTNSVELEWHQYLVEAFFRLDPDWKVDYPWTTVLRSPSARDYAASEQWVREDIEGKGGFGGAIMIAAPSAPESLIHLMETTMPDLKRGTLKGRRVYVCVPATYRERAEEALAPTGATFVFLDPNVPIPQRRERLENYLKRD